MSYENPITVVDTESAKIRAAGMASFGQSVGSAVTALGERQRAEAKQRLKENKELLNNKTKINDVYQQNIWQAQDAFKTEAGFDISPQVSAQFNTWADEGADLKARRDASDDPILRRELQGQINVYDKFFLGGGMTSQFESFTSMQSTVMDKAGPGKGGTVGNLSLSSIDNQTLNDFTSTSSNGGKGLTVSGNSTTRDENGNWSPLSLSANFTGGGSYNMSTIGNGDLVTIPDMQDGAQVALEKGGFVGKGNKIDPTSREFLDNYAKMDGETPVMTTRVVAGKTIEYVMIDEAKFLNTLSGTYDATIASYSRGSIQEGDSSTGLRQMQAYIDDVLDDMPESDWARFSELTGIPLLKDGGGPGFTLTAGSHEIEGGDGTVLDKNSYDNLKKALGIQKYLEVDKKVQGIEVKGPTEPTQTQIKAQQKLLDQQGLDNDANSLILEAIQNEEGAGTGLYNILMDPSRASDVNFSERDSEKLKNTMVPAKEINSFLSNLDIDSNELDAERASQITGIQFTNQKQYENWVSGKSEGSEIGSLSSWEKENVGNNVAFFSIDQKYRPGEPLNQDQAYKLLLEDIPKYINEGRTPSNLQTRTENVRKSPAYNIPVIKKQIKSLGTRAEFIKKNMDPDNSKIDFNTATEPEKNAELQRLREQWSQDNEKLLKKLEKYESRKK